MGFIGDGFYLMMIEEQPCDRYQGFCPAPIVVTDVLMFQKGKTKLRTCRILLGTAGGNLPKNLVNSRLLLRAELCPPSILMVKS